MAGIPRRPHFVIHWADAGPLDPGERLVLTKRFLGFAKGIYLVVGVEDSKRWPQYVGMTFNQNLATRVGQHLQGLQRFGATFPSERRLFVGVVEPKIYKTLSRKMLAEIEDFLIWALQPLGNSAQLKPYRGREMLMKSEHPPAGIPRFFYACPAPPLVIAAYGDSMDQLTPRVFPLTDSFPK